MLGETAKKAKNAKKATTAETDNKATTAETDKAPDQSATEPKKSHFAGFTNIREYLAAKPLALRWVILIGFIFYCITLAEYGPGYSAAEFIYKDF